MPSHDIIRSSKSTKNKSHSMGISGDRTLPRKNKNSRYGKSNPLELFQPISGKKCLNPLSAREDL